MPDDEALFRLSANCCLKDWARVKVTVLVEKGAGDDERPDIAGSISFGKGATKKGKTRRRQRKSLVYFSICHLN